MIHESEYNPEQTLVLLPYAHETLKKHSTKHVGI